MPDPTASLKLGEETTLRHTLTDAQLDHHLDKPISLTVTCAKSGRRHTASMTLAGGAFDIRCRCGKHLAGTVTGRVEKPKPLHTSMNVTVTADEYETCRHKPMPGHVTCGRCGHKNPVAVTLPSSRFDINCGNCSLYLNNHSRRWGPVSPFVRPKVIRRSACPTRFLCT
jgi:hypothetical protein